MNNPSIKMLLDAVRGALIGFAEIIPGVSGGAIALIVGVYERVVFSASNLVRLRFREVEWRLILPLLVGMFAAIFAGAAIIEPLLTNYPSLVLAFFVGLIVASLRVPYRMAAAGADRGSASDAPRSRAAISGCRSARSWRTLANGKSMSFS